MKKMNYVKAGFTIILAIYGIICALDVTVPRFLDRFDLIAHEAGHLFFSYFGQFIMAIGGTIGQLFVPAAITVYFYLRRELYSAAVTFFWLGQNFFNISVYVRDARAMALPLVSVGGGEDTIHDWNYLLSTVGLLRWDHAIAGIVYSVGLLIIIAAVGVGFYLSIDREEE